MYILIFWRKASNFFPQGFSFTDYKMCVDTFMVLALKLLHSLWLIERQLFNVIWSTHPPSTYFRNSQYIRHPGIKRGDLPNFLPGFVCLYMFLKSKFWNKHMPFIFLFKDKITNIKALSPKNSTVEMLVFISADCLSFSQNDRNSKG